MVAAGTGHTRTCHKKLTQTAGEKFSASAASGPEPTANHKTAPPPADPGRQDRHRRRPPGIRSLPDKSTSYTRACTRAQGSPAGFRSIPGLVRRQGHPPGLTLARRGWINHHPATFVARIHQASTGAIRCPPQPAALSARIPMGAGGDGFGQLDRPAGFIHQDKTKARTLIGGDRRKIARREGHAGTDGNRAHRLWWPRRRWNRRSSNTCKRAANNQTTPFPSTM